MNYRRSPCQTPFWEREVPLVASSFKRCKTRAVSSKHRAKLTVCRANKQERHIICFRCTERLWNTAVNERVNSRAYRRNLDATEVRGRRVIAVKQNIHLSSQYPNFTCKTMDLKFAVRAGNPCSHCHVWHFTLQKHKNYRHAADCVQFNLELVTVVTIKDTNPVWTGSS